MTTNVLKFPGKAHQNPFPSDIAILQFVSSQLEIAQKHTNNLIKSIEHEARWVSDNVAYVKAALSLQSASATASHAPVLAEGVQGGRDALDLLQLLNAHARELDRLLRKQNLVLTARLTALHLSQ